MVIPTEYEIDFQCGHTEKRDLSHKPAGDRAGFAAWLAKTQCSDCFSTSAPKRKKEYAKKFAEEAREEAQAAAEKMGLPQLEGSDKQVGWALTVRNNLLLGAHDALVEGEAASMTEAEFTERVLEPAQRIVRAGWWIDNREQDAADLEELVTDVADENVTENPY